MSYEQLVSERTNPIFKVLETRVDGRWVVTFNPAERAGAGGDVGRASFRPTL